MEKNVGKLLGNLDRAIALISGLALLLAFGLGMPTTALAQQVNDATVTVCASRLGRISIPNDKCRLGTTRIKLARVRGEIEEIEVSEGEVLEQFDGLLEFWFRRSGSGAGVPAGCTFGFQSERDLHFGRGDLLPAGDHSDWPPRSRLVQISTRTSRLA